MHHWTCGGDETAEDIMQRTESVRPNLADNEHWLATKRLVAGVLKYGTFKCTIAPTDVRRPRPRSAAS